MMSNIEITFHFIKGPYVEIHGSGNEEYDVEFIDMRTTETIFATKLKSGQWARASRQWFTEWRLRVSRGGSVYLDHRFDCHGKRVYIAMDSKCLGDNIAWIPYAQEFARTHRCQVVVSTFFNDLFKQEYPELIFVEPGETVDDLYAMYEIGCFGPPWGGPRDLNPIDYRTIPLQRVASDILGLEYMELHPEVSVAHAAACKSDEVKSAKYVCLTNQSTAGAKLWHYPDGWQRVVDFLNDKGYEVVVISKEETQLNNVIDLTGDRPLSERAHMLSHAAMFIGLGSGLSWLAWAVNTPVILISGFSEIWSEFSSGVERIQNPKVCHGCWNDTRFEFDKGDWNWCPIYKGTDRQFECSKSIRPEVILSAIESIENLQSEKNLNLKQIAYSLAYV